MKGKKLIISAIVLALMVFIYLLANYGKEDVNEETLKMIEKELQDRSFKNAEGFGVLPNGTFYIHETMLKGKGHVLLVISKEEGVKSSEDETVFDPGFKTVKAKIKTESEIVIRMEKIGSYYVALPSDEFKDPSFHFETEVEVFFPRR